MSNTPPSVVDRYIDGTPSVIAVPRPRGGGWEELPLPPPLPMFGYPTRLWFHKRSGIRVIAAVERTTDAVCDGPEYHLSISRLLGGRVSRVDRNDALWVLGIFGVDGAREDNHVPHGLVRNFWRPVAGDWVGVKCKCEDDEPAIVEDKGDFVWRVAPDSR